MKKMTAIAIPSIDSNSPPTSVRINPKINRIIFIIRLLNTRKTIVVDKKVRTLSIFCCCGVSSCSSSELSDAISTVSSVPGWDTFEGSATGRSSTTGFSLSSGVCSVSACSSAIGSFFPSDSSLSESSFVRSSSAFSSSKSSSSSNSSG